MAKAEKIQLTLLMLKDSEAMFVSDDDDIVMDIASRIEVEYDVRHLTTDSIRDAVDLLAEADRLNRENGSPRPERELVPKTLVREAEQLLIKAPTDSKEEYLRMRDSLANIISAIQRNNLSR